MPRDPADRIWFVDPREVQVGPADDQGLAPMQRVLVAEDVDAALSELTPILLRIGGGVTIVAERVRLEDGSYTTERVIIRWQAYVGKARQQKPAGQNGGDPQPAEAPEEAAPAPAPEPESEPEEQPAHAEG